jgi:hypothetical protein
LADDKVLELLKPEEPMKDPLSSPSLDEGHNEGDGPINDPNL